MADTLNDSLALIARAQAGEHDALEQVFERYYAPVRAYVRRRLGPRLRPDCDSLDIMQETFLIALERFDRFEVRSEAALISWLSKIAENRILAQHRRRTAEKRDRDREVALDALRETLTALQPRPIPEARITLPGVACERAEDLARLEQALEELDEDLRELVLHRYVGEATWDEVADLMGLGSGANARRLHAKALAALAWKLGGEAP